MPVADAHGRPSEEVLTGNLAFPSADASPRAQTDARAALEALPDLILWFDREGRVTDAQMGSAFEALLPRGVARENRDRIISAHVHDRLRAAVQRAQSSREMVAIEYALTSGAQVNHYEARVMEANAFAVVAFVRDITGRKRAEEELFKSREMLRQVLDTIPQRVFWKNRDCVYVGCNTQLARDVGFRDPAELIGKTDFDLSSAIIADVYRADDAEVMRSDRPKLNFDEPLHRADGTRRWLRTSKAPLHDSEGRVIGILGSYEDVTERMQVDLLRSGQNRILEMIVSGAPLKETLARLARLMQSMVDGMLCSVMLVEAETSRLRPFVAPNLPPEFMTAVDNIPIAEGQGSCGTAAARAEVVITPDVYEDPRWRAYLDFARTFDVRACWSAPILSSQRAVLGTFAMYFRNPRSASQADLELIDIASHLAGIAVQRKNAEDALRAAEEKYRNIFERALDGIFQISPDGRILEANPAFARMFGHPTSTALMAAVTDVAQQLCSQPERYAEFARALQAQGVVQRWELPMRGPDGGVLWISVDARLARAASGQELCFEGIAEDVTDRKRLEQQFLRSQKMEAFGQLAGGVAHDFNNLLTVILGNLSLIRLGDLDGAIQQSAIEDCFRAAQRAANLTGQLLTFSRRQPLEPCDLDLNEVVANMSKLLQRVIGEHIILHTSYAIGGASVRADAGMMEQVLMNLALNSRDAMGVGGKLEIQTRAIDLDAAAAWATGKGRPGSFVRLSVRDTGSGIAPQHLSHIFEPFFTTKEVGKGTGLGLATVFGIVEQHDGWIDVESEPGQGTTMHVYLPRLVSAAAPLVVSDAVGVPRRGSETILLAEDEAEVRALMVKLLERHGYHVTAASNGVEALALWEQHKGDFTLLITDMVMPGGIGGRELAERLLAQRANLKVIFCSGYTDEMLGRDSPLRNNPNFLEKPFDLHTFLGRVRSALDAAGK